MSSFIYNLSHGFALDGTKIHDHERPLEDIWLYLALFLSDAKASFRSARACYFRDLCQWYEAHWDLYRSSSTLRSKVYWRHLVESVLSTDAPFSFQRVSSSLFLLGISAGNAVLLKLRIRLLTTYFSCSKILKLWCIFFLPLFIILLGFFVGFFFHTALVVPASLTYRSDVVDSSMPNFKGVKNSNKAEEAQH